jgi:hypothetical protein
MPIERRDERQVVGDERGLRIRIEQLQDRRRLAGVGARRDEVRAIVEGDARGVHERDVVLGEVPAQNGLDAVGVQHVG